MFKNDISFFLVYCFAVIFLLYVKEQFNSLKMIPRQNKDNSKFVLVYCYIMASDWQNFIFIHIQHGNYLFTDGMAKSDQGGIC